MGRKVKAPHSDIHLLKTLVDWSRSGSKWCRMALFWIPRRFPLSSIPHIYSTWQRMTSLPSALRHWHNSKSGMWEHPKSGKLNQMRQKRYDFQHQPLKIPKSLQSDACKNWWIMLTCVWIWWFDTPCSHFLHPVQSPKDLRNAVDGGHHTDLQEARGSPKSKHVSTCTPRKLRCPQKRDIFKTWNIIFQPLAFRGYVSFRGNTYQCILKRKWQASKNTPSKGSIF